AGLCCPVLSRSVPSGRKPQRYYAGSDSCPARTRRTGLSASFVSPSEHPAPNHVVGPSVVFAVVSTRPAGLMTQASPWMSRLAAPRRRNGFVILRAVRSPPAAPHPVSRRRSCLRLHVPRLHFGWTFTLLTRQHHGRTHPGKAGGSPQDFRVQDPGSHMLAFGLVMFAIGALLANVASVSIFALGSLVLAAIGFALAVHGGWPIGEAVLAILGCF